MNRFELVLLASHRARAISTGAIAIRETLWHLRDREEELAQDDQSTDTQIDKMTQEEMLRMRARLAPSDGSNGGPHSC